MSYFNVKQHVRDMTHTDSQTLTDALFDKWNPEVASELSVRMLSNDRLETFSVTTAASFNPFFVGFNNGEVLELWCTSTGGRQYPLRNASRQRVREAMNLSGDPIYYCQEGDRIRIAPYADGVTVNGTYREPVTPFTSDTDSTTEFNVYPQVYYYAFLKRAFHYLQDYESAELNRQLFETEIERIVAREKRIAAGASRETRGAWQWV